MKLTKLLFTTLLIIAVLVGCQPKVADETTKTDTTEVKNSDHLNELLELKYIV